MTDWTVGDEGRPGLDKMDWKERLFFIYLLFTNKVT